MRADNEVGVNYEKIDYHVLLRLYPKGATKGI